MAVHAIDLHRLCLWRCKELLPLITSLMSKLNQCKTFGLGLGFCLLKLGSVLRSATLQDSGGKNHNNRILCRRD